MSTPQVQANPQDRVPQDQEVQERAPQDRVVHQKHRVHQARDVRKENRLAFGLMALAALLALVLLCLPSYHFQATAYRKKSGNTFVGDERYEKALAEVQAVQEDYKSRGIDLTLSEEVTERTNSKGKTTSLVEFRLSNTYTKSALDFYGSGLASSWILQVILLAILLSLACAAAGLVHTIDEPWRSLSPRTASLRTASGLLALLATLMVPPFIMSNTFDLSRQVNLYTTGIQEQGKEIFYNKLDHFLFAGQAGDTIEDSLSGLKFTNSIWIWLVMACSFVMLVAAIQLRKGKIKPVLLRGLLYFFVIAICLFILYPYYVMTVTAFRTSAETNDMYFMHLFPTEWKLSNLKDILSQGVPRYLLNSLLIAGGATLVALICGIPAAYAISRMQFKGRKAFLGFVIMSQMFSPVVLLIGISQLMVTLGLNDSILGLILINAAFNQAFAIWLLRGTFLSISPEMEQAARIDGCSTMGSLWHVLLPMAAPGIVTTLIFVFINAWNEYTVATVLIKSASNRPITVGITQFSSFNMIEWHYLFAASLLATLPVVILFMTIEKHLTSGLTAGGVKG